MQIDVSCLKTTKPHWINKNDLLDRVMQSVGDFTSVFADIEMDNLPTSENNFEQEKFMTAIVGFEGACNGVAWASCSESFAELMANRMKRVDLTRIEEGKRAAMTDMITLLGGDIRLLFSPANKDIRLSEISVYKADEFDCSEIIENPANLRCQFKHIDEHLYVGVLLGKCVQIPRNEKSAFQSLLPE